MRALRMANLQNNRAAKLVVGLDREKMDFLKK